MITIQFIKKIREEYCLLKTEAFGTLLMMEVGALLVGKIQNRETGRASVKRGEEKGNFAFGGSTIIVVTGGIRRCRCCRLQRKSEQRGKSAYGWEKRLARQQSDGRFLRRFAGLSESVTENQRNSGI